MNVEQLPVTIKGKDDTEYYLRIKARDPQKGKKWVVRYIRKVTTDDKYRGTDWKYRTEIQCWGNNLERTATRMLKRIDEFIN